MVYLRFIYAIRNGTARFYDTKGKLFLEISYKNDKQKKGCVEKNMEK